MWRSLAIQINTSYRLLPRFLDINLFAYRAMIMTTMMMIMMIVGLSRETQTE
uniref:Homeobox protein n=1 Tax=Rhizophora mucronata TaxID=61149 RepID=A0A2P2L1N9_RHIMU